jgi:hypothetical protein
VLRAPTGFIKNIKTGENYGKIVYLYEYHYDNLGNKLLVPERDNPEHYEIVTEGVNNE